jgi:SET domain-containing protein
VVKNLGAMILHPYFVPCKFKNKPMQRLPGIYFAPSEKGGRGVFSAIHISEGTLIEVCPMIVLPEEDFQKIHDSTLHDYYFLWGDEENQCAIALGFGSLYNNDYEPNARYFVDPEEETMEIYAIREIFPGDEITVTYNGHPDDKSLVWFEDPAYDKEKNRNTKEG